VVRPSTDRHTTFPVRGWVSRANRSDKRWATDVTRIPWGRDGWAHLAAVIGYHGREVVG
jgi:putative transposase